MIGEVFFNSNGVLKEYNGTKVLYKTDPNIVYDYDGNEYRIVTIGSQCWLTSSFKGSKDVSGNTLSGYYDTDTGVRMWLDDVIFQNLISEFHVPTRDEYDTLLSNFGTLTAGNPCYYSKTLANPNPLLATGSTWCYTDYWYSGTTRNTSGLNLLPDTHCDRMGTFWGSTAAINSPVQCCFHTGGCVYGLSAGNHEWSTPNIANIFAQIYGMNVTDDINPPYHQIRLIKNIC